MHLGYKEFWLKPTWVYNKIRLVAFQTVDPDICSIFIFYGRVYDQLFQHILWMVFQEKYFLHYTPLKDKTLLSGFLYFLRCLVTSRL